MSHIKKSRSIINFPVFSRRAENKDSKKLVGNNRVYYDLGENETNLKKSEGKNCENRDMQTTNLLTHSYSTTDSDLDEILNLSTKLSGLSSSSSASWSEDYELEITKKVQVELEKLHKAFQGLGDVPPPHDKDEVAEWKHFFPHLCILGEKTPTNSTENSEASSESENETPTLADIKLKNIENRNISVLSQNKNAVRKKRVTEEQAQTFLNASKSYHTLPPKPKSLEIEKYLKISSIKSPETLTRKQISQPELNIRRASKELANMPLDYISLPFITATSLKNQIRRQPRKNSKLLTLPPILNSFRSISATPRQSSSKSMFVSLNFEKDSSARGDQMRLRSDLMKLFDFIPISNR